MRLLAVGNLIKKLLARCFKFFGYELKKAGEPKPVDVRAFGNHPAQLLYYGDSRPILVNLPINKGRGLRILPLDQPEQHPFVFASCAWLRSDNGIQSILQTLEHYYDAVQPVTATDWLGLKDCHPSELHEEPPRAISMPWDTRTPSDWRKARENFAIKESRSAGLALSIDDGWHFWGPVHPKKLQLESIRIEKLLDSVQKNGIQRHDGHDGDIRAVVLRAANGEWCWQVAGGEHRAAVLSAFGYSSIPVRVMQVVHRDDVDVWPGVIAGVFSKQSALATFDRIVEGQVPALVKQWEPYVNPLAQEPVNKSA